MPQKCQAHKLRNILSKLPRGVQMEIKKQIHAVFYARDYETGVKKGRALIEQYQDLYPKAMECLSKSLEECLTCLKLPEAATSCFFKQPARQLRQSTLKSSLLLKLLHKPIVDQIFRLQAANFFVCHS